MASCFSLHHNDTDDKNELQANPFETDLQELKTLAYGFVGTAVVILGIVGNILNLVILTRPNLNGVTYTYLAYLAVSDLLTLVLSETSLIRLQGIEGKAWLTAIYFSHLELPLVNALMACSVFLVVLVTLDRYMSVCHPTRFKTVHNHQWIRKFTIAACSLAVLVYVPVCLEKIPFRVGDQEFIACENVIVVSNVYYQVYLMVKELLVRLGPVVGLVFLNASVIYTVCLRRRRFQQRYSSNNSFRRKITRERSLTILLVAIVFSFLLCVMPASILTLLHSEEKEFHFDFQVFRAVANVLEIANYALNFYLYCLFSPEIRMTLLKFIKEIFSSCH